MSSNFSILDPIKVALSGRALDPHTGPMGWFKNIAGIFAGSADADLIVAISGGATVLEFTGVDNNPNAYGSIRFYYDLSTAVIQLPLSTVSFNNLPPGFTIRTVKLTIFGVTVACTDAGGVEKQSRTVIISLGNKSTQFFDNMNTGLTPGDMIVDLLVANQLSTMLDILSTGFTITTSLITNNPIANQSSILTTTGFTINGTYDIISSSWILSPSTAKAGDMITITGTGDSLLDGVAEIHVQYIDADGNLHDIVISAQDFITQSATRIIFYLPQFGNISTTVYVYVVGDGVRFIGSSLVGPLIVVFSDSSGIYLLVPSKSTDTIYDRTTPGATKDVNIPDPFIKTGFLP